MNIRCVRPARRIGCDARPGWGRRRRQSLQGALGTLCALLSLLAVVPRAQAFCGFFVSGADAKLYNNASQVALLRVGNRTAMTLSNNYQGPPEDFAMVVPVPVVLQKEQVKTLPANVFERIDRLSAPRLVEYGEQDPCYVRHLKYKKSGKMPARSAVEESADAEGSARRHHVKIEAKFEVGEYQIFILSAKDSTGLDAWLRENRYKIPAGAAAALAPYVREQMKFFVAKVDIKKVHRDSHGFVVLSPLRFTFDSPELRLPVRLGLLNANGKQDLLIYVLHPSKRFEVANYPNVFIPTNIEVADSVRQGFGSFYAELFDETLRRHNNRAVITEYAWQASSCDPCPLPPLGAQDVYLLGDESMAERGKQSGLSGDDDGGYYGDPVPYVLTRLHTRYDAKTLSDDLIFREAKPVVGGRANGSGGLGDSGARLTEDEENNFQGRYIIRHYWEGPVACEAPQSGRWGGPPASVRAQRAADAGDAQAALDLANAPRGKVRLSTVVQSPVPLLGLSGKKRALRPKEKAQSATDED